MAVKIAGPLRQRRRGSAGGRRGWRRGLAVAGVVGAAVAGLFWCYLRLSATFPGGSDAASNALEAWDLVHGNWLLRGWTLTDVSFYTTELPEYAVVELVRGLGPGVLHTAAALTYTLLVLVAALLARGRARGAAGWARALIAAGVMVAPQLGNGVHVLLAQPDHAGTQVLILGVFLIVDRAPRRWYTAAAAGLLLAAAMVADKITIVDAVVPLAFAGLLHAVWARRPSARRFELSLALAAGAAAGAGLLAVALIGRAGGFTLLPVQTALAAPASLPAHLSLAWHGVLSLFGADVTAAPNGPQTVLAWLHAPGIALAVAAFAVTAWRLPGPDDLVSDVLAVGIVINLAGFVASVIPATAFDTREIAALLPFGAVLAGRVFGPWLASPGPGPRSGPGYGLRSGPPSGPRSSGPPDSRPRRCPRPESSGRRHRLLPPVGWPRVGWPLVRWPLVRWPLVRWPHVGWPHVGWPHVRPGVAALVAAGACQLAALGYGTAQPPAVDPEQALAGWLVAQHLTCGLGTFTEDNITTLDSGGAVRLLTVSWLSPALAAQAALARLPVWASRAALAGQLVGPGEAAVPRVYQSSASWYDPRTQYADFVVTGTADGTADLIPPGEILALAGPPARTYKFQSFTIMVWNTNLLALLGSTPSRVPGDIGRS